MSHQVVLKTKIIDKVVLEDTLRDLGYTFSYDKEIIDYHGKNVGKVDIVIDNLGKSNKVGFAFSNDDQSYNVVGDFWGCNATEAKFTNSVKKTYAEKKVVSLLVRDRYNVVSKKNTENNTIKIVARSIVA